MPSEMPSQSDFMIDRARELRKKMSPPEVILWIHLRPKVNKVFRLRRQVSILSCYVLDFYFAPLRIAFEIDGRAFHEGRSLEDTARDLALANAGISTVGIAAYSVFNDCESVVALIRGLCLGSLKLTDLEPHMVTIAKNCEPQSIED
jgi:very-short-patch-repair endonuclease